MGDVVQLPKKKKKWKPVKRFKFTVERLNKLPAPESGVKEYRDTEEPALMIRVSQGGTKTFAFTARVANASGRKIGKRIKLGRYPTLKLIVARNLVRERMLELSKPGADPHKIELIANARAMTLGEVLQDYFAAKSNLKPGTVRSYNDVLNENVKDWMEKPLVDIGRQEIRKRYLRVAKRTKSRANSTMRTLRAIFNYFMGAYQGAMTENPVKVLSDAGIWLELRPKKTYLRADDIAAWWAAISNLSGKKANSDAGVVGLLLKFLLFTGLRKNEAAQLRWNDVDTRRKQFTVLDTKNSEPLSLPITKPVAC